MLKVQNLKKVYKISDHKVVALDDVSFELPNGKLVAIVGPSGCGKTTLMNILGALDGDFEGDIFVNSKSLKEAKNKDLDSYRKNTIGFIFQQFNLLNSQKVLDNVTLALDLSGVHKEAKVKKAKSLLDRVGILEQGKKKVNLLSGGQKQRVAIARALANDPEIILADEPTGALDSKTGKQVMKILKKISKERLVLVVTHEPELAEEYADLIITMEDGKVLSINENSSLVQEEIPSIEKEETKSKMSLFKAIKLSLRNAWLKKGRTLATSIGTSIGITGIALAISLTNGTSTAVETQVKGIFPTNSIMVTLKENKDKSPIQYVPLKYSDIEPIYSASDNFYAYYFPIEGNDTWMPAFYSMDESLLKEENFFEKLSDPLTIDKLIDMMNFGLLDDIKDSIQYGTLPKEGSLNEIVISLSTAENIVGKDGDISSLIGKDINVGFYNAAENRGKKPKLNVKKWNIVGIANTSTVMNTFYISSDWNIRYYEKEFNLDRNKLAASSMIVYGKNADTIEADIKKLNDSQDKYQYEMAAKTITAQVDGALSQVRIGLIGFSGVSVLVAALMISIVIYISVLERTNEIGILRAIGARKRDIMNIFVAESLIIGILSATIGIGIAVLLSKGINELVYKFLETMANNAPYMEVAKLPYKDGIFILLFCVALSAISGLYPSLRAAKMDPIEALRKK